MSKGQRGNKEAKKPKQVRVPVAPTTPGASAPVVLSELPGRGNKHKK